MNATESKLLRLLLLFLANSCLLGVTALSQLHVDGEGLISRRHFFPTAIVALASPLGFSTAVSAEDDLLLTKAQAEYTNSITASRDTNVSPGEAYDSIISYIPKNDRGPKSKALDVGAGAGLSTSYLYNKLGYKTIDAVDWSGDAWRSNVLSTPSSVIFFEMDDESFYSKQSTQSEGIKNSYDVICYNFAINPAKAVRVAKDFLTEDGVLFAPINDKAEYWYKQTYYVLNSKGQIKEKSGAEVGAWSIQFQPDVTSPTCTGIWCGDMNGFNEKKKKWRQ